jgi:cholesterol oxidase
MGTQRQPVFDVIVVGTGFGGSVCAARLAEKGMRVLILERGPWWGPLNRNRPVQDRRELPRGILGVRKLIRSLRVNRSRGRFEKCFHVDGLLEAHSFEHLNSITASGVGGGSHIYTNILQEPSADFFEAFPGEITAAAMHPYFERVRAMLRPAPVPVVPQKNRAFAAALDAAELPAADYPDLAIAWGKDSRRPEKRVNAAGVVQSTSTFRGDVFVGCEDGSKTTLDLTYLPLALRHDAKLRPLCEVLRIGTVGGGYWVSYRDHRSSQIRQETAPRLVLAAGGLNTQRLLFDARDGHRSLPNLPGTLGRRFSPNADFVVLLWKTRTVKDSSRGPSVGAVSSIRRGRTHLYAIGELGLPVQALPLPEFLCRRLRLSTFLFSMGRDASNGRTGFDGRALATDVGRSLDPALYNEMETAMTRMARHYRPKRLLSNFLAGRGPEGLFTVHPLGGCSIGSSPRDGFTDHRGEVFGHPGLFVADGSLYPRSPGIPPSMTIAALAERQAELMAQ